MTVVKRYPRSDDEWFRTLTENSSAVVEAAMLELGSFRLQLVQYHDGGTSGGTGHSAIGGLHICVEIEDVDATHAALSTRGEYHVGPIVRRGPYGGRSFYVHDPDGVPVELERRDD